jgi:threonine dehydrogenase-like Zn-dependent dehydrogenase
VLDGHPGLSDRISVFGLGTIGLSVMGLLSRFPLVRLRAYDLYPLRREAAAAMGASAADPRAEPPLPGTEDIVFELTGSPEALGAAVSAAAFSGLVVLGSWYGAKPFVERLGSPAQPDPGQSARGTAVHRSRVRIVASQVSTIDPSLSGRWDRQRRFETAWNAIRALGPSRWVTHRVPFKRAGEAYRALAERPGESIQVLLTY